MTVAELIEKLNDCPKDAIVVMSSDAEGNKISPLDEVSHGVYTPEPSSSVVFVRARKSLL